MNIVSYALPVSVVLFFYVDVQIIVTEIKRGLFSLSVSKIVIIGYFLKSKKVCRHPKDVSSTIATI